MGERTVEIEREIAERRQETGQKIDALRERVRMDMASAREDVTRRTQQMVTATEQTASRATGFLNLRADNMLLAGLAIGFVTGFMDLGANLESDGASRRNLESNGAGRRSLESDGAGPRSLNP